MPSSNLLTVDLDSDKKDKTSMNDSIDIHSDVTKIIGDEGNGSSVGSWQSVYSPTTETMSYQPVKGIGKYKQSLKQLIPIRVRTGPGSSMPVDQAGFFAFILFSWLTPLVWRAYKKGLNMADIYYCSPFESAKVNGTRLSAIWDKIIKERSGKNSLFRHALYHFISTRYIVACFAYILCLVFGFVGPTLFLRMLLIFSESEREETLEGVLWTVGLFLSEALRVLTFVTLWAINCRTAIRVQAGLTFLLYKKLVKLRALPGKTAGELINLFSNDTNKVMLMVYTAPLIIGGPLLIVATLVYTWYLIGVYSLVGVAVFCSAYAFQFLISRLTTSYRKKAISTTDERISLMGEILTYIKLIKLYAWERPFASKVSEVRQRERALLEKCQFLQAISASTAVLIPVLATVLTVITYTLRGNNLHPSEAFTILMLNTIAAHGLKTLPLCIRDLVNGFVALMRVEVFLKLDEKYSYATIPSRPDIAVYVSKATISWPVNAGDEHDEILTANKLLTVDTDQEDNAALVIPLSPQPALVNINLTLPVGQVFGVCGSVASGKSSLLSALLGQMQLVTGQVSLKNSVGYVSQQSWILNATLKDNILFGHPFNSKRYYEAVYCCSLTDDIASLPHGDQTEIGDNGITLSGGQKQRLSLARALYANKDLYLLDDPFSAVDYQVGKHVFQHCIKGALRGKSILLVTNQIQYLQECDKVLFMSDGQIAEEGTHETLMKDDIEYAHFINNVNDELLNTSMSSSRDFTEPGTPESTRGELFRGRSRSPSTPKSITSLANSMSDSVDDGLAATGIMNEETGIQGQISCETYQSYIVAGGGYIICFLVLFWYLFHACGVAFSNWWLSFWLDQGNGEKIYNEDTGLRIQTSITDNPDLDMYESVYGVTALATVVISLIMGFLYVKTTFRASSSFHDKLLQRVLYCPMRFFETVPMGRIINIFTRDLDELDVLLPVVLDAFLQHSMAIIFSLLLVAFVFHWFYIAIIIILIVYVFLYRMFRLALNDLKRLENVSRAPVYSHISASANGLSTIQAFQRQDEFVDRFSHLVDRHSSPLYLYYSSLRWLGVRMDFACLVITLLVCLLAVFLKNEAGPAYTGLAIVLAMQFSGILQYLARMGCEVESRFTSVERIHNYTTNLETEASSLVEQNKPASDWPTRGRISFREVHMRYRPGLPLALKGITFDISPHEKIGIVGQTGAGKSSIGVVLFRLVELSSGTIHIDGVDISKIGLEDLRSNLSIIPQDPILFCGTVRQNMDPLNTFEDNELWDALEKTQMKEKIISMKGALDATVEDRGENFSVGERQLLCLARSLLRHSKVVILDEATASMDSETDQTIQHTIQDVFAESTILIIAHRLNTVLNCDRIMVLDHGKVVEFDTPSVLLSNPKSRFSQLNQVTHL